MMDDAPTTTVRTEPLSPVTQAALSLIQGLLPAMIAIIGGLWVASTYVQNQKEAQVSAALQAKIAEKQKAQEIRVMILEAYKGVADRQETARFEIAQRVGRILSNEIGTPEWKEAEQNFWEIYWQGILGPNENLVARTERFVEALKNYKVNQDVNTRHKLETSGRDFSSFVLYQIGEDKMARERRIYTEDSDDQNSGSETKM